LGTDCVSSRGSLHPYGKKRGGGAVRLPWRQRRGTGALKRTGGGAKGVFKGAVEGLKVRLVRLNAPCDKKGPGKRGTETRKTTTTRSEKRPRWTQKAFKSVLL